MEVRQVPKRRASAFVGGYVTSDQREKLRALAILCSKSVNALLCDMIDAAVARAADVHVHVPKTQNHADSVLADNGVVLNQHHSSKPVAPRTPAADTAGADAVTGTARNEASSW